MRPRWKSALLLIPLLLIAMLAGGFAGQRLQSPAAAIWESELEACRRLAPRYSAAAEVRLDDGCRVDLLSDAEAIEVDWAKKWPEAVGQSLYYALKTSRQPAIILLTRNAQYDARYADRCKLVCERVSIALYLEPATKRMTKDQAPMTNTVAGFVGHWDLDTGHF